MTELPDFLLIPSVIVSDEEIPPLAGYTYGVIYWYTKLKLQKCIASNASLAKMLNTQPRSIQRALQQLKDKGYIQVALDEKGHRTEIIPLVAFDLRPDSRTPHDQMVVPPRPNGHHNKNIQQEKLLTKVSKAKARGSEETYGHEEINLILSRFKQHIGVIPADRRPRFVAHNIRQIINRFIRDHRVAYQAVRGGELTFEYLLDKAWEHLLSKDYGNQIEKLETFKLKTRVYLDGASQALNKAYETKRH